jgi:hypothetical protein
VFSLFAPNRSVSVQTWYIDNLTRAATELNTVAGAKINMDKIALKLEVATGKAFVPDSQRYKNNQS